jgi:hypothetical protein
VRFLNDLKRGSQREADKVRVADVLRINVELQGGSALRKVFLADERPLISCVQKTFLLNNFLGWIPDMLPKTHLLEEGNHLLIRCLISSTKPWGGRKGW